jgi:transposase
MKPLTVSDAKTMIFGLQDEIRRSEESRYDHRLHGVLLVAQGMSCLEVSRLLGDGPRTVQYWIRRFEEKGLGGLIEGVRSGRPRRLTEDQLAQVGDALRQSPESVGIEGGLWDGKGLAHFLRNQFKVSLGIRQCQNMFRQLGFRLRKPRPLIAHADPAEQKAYKKTLRRLKKRSRD